MRQYLFLGIAAATNLASNIFFQWYPVAHFGIGHDTDALIAGWTIPLFFLSVLGGSLPFVLVPLLVAMPMADRRQAARMLFITAFPMVLAFFLVFALWSDFWVELLFRSKDEHIYHLTLACFRINLLSLFFMLFQTVWASVLQASERYYWPEIAQITGSALALALMPWVLSFDDIEAVAWLINLRSALQCACLVPVAWGALRAPAGNDEVIQVTWRRLRPLVFSALFLKSEVLLDRVLASWLPAGALTSLQLSLQVHSAVGFVAGRPIGMPLLGRFSRTDGVNRGISIKKIARSWLLRITVVGLAGVACFWILKPWIVEFVVWAGFGDESRARELFFSILGLSGLLLGSLYGTVLSQAFYAMSDTGTPTAIGVVGFMLGAAMKIAGTLLFGLAGLVSGISAYYLMNAALLYFFMERKLDERAAGR